MVVRPGDQADANTRQRGRLAVGLRGQVQHADIPSATDLGLTTCLEKVHAKLRSRIGVVLTVPIIACTLTIPANAGLPSSFWLATQCLNIMPEFQTELLRFRSILSNNQQKTTIKLLGYSDLLSS